MIACSPSCQSCPMFSHSIFSGLSSDLLDKLRSIKTTRTVRKGHALITQGFPSPGFFCSLEGRFKFTLLGNHGQETLVSLSRAGELIAFMGQDAPFSVVAVENCKVCFYPMEGMSELLDREPQLSRRFLDYSAQQSQLAIVRLSRMLGKSARERIQMLLHELVQFHGERKGDNVEVKTQLSREELSSMVGLAPETLIRMLADFKEEGIVQQVGRKMFINGPERLAKKILTM